ncbi:MAG: riboflavin biosynthesis protein RibD [Gammaproteobacteria bacterium]|nr:MAG: riboflavin biosynthesis protein RibD [Gammaproteobacteria bacterium]
MVRFDTEYMARAIQLAQQGLFTTDPNPRVGCVLVKQNSIIGEGWHQIAGEPHAEVHALHSAGVEARGCTAYVTLEPCSHFGKTPPCANALIDAGVSRVVFATVDPNPLVAGKGAERLVNAGIQIDSGVLSEQAKALNPGFFSRFERGRPYIRIKMAMSVDGRTAMQSGESQWITGPPARADVQKLRARSSAIVTGSGTVKYDDPKMTVRARLLRLSSNPEIDARQHELLQQKAQPDRYIIAATGQILASSQIFRQPGKSCLVIPDCIDSRSAYAHLIDTCSHSTSTHSSQGPALAGVRPAEFELLPLPVAKVAESESSVSGDRLRVDLDAFVHELDKRGCNEILVEAGAGLAGEFVQAGLVDELWLYMAPVLMGSEARPLLQLPVNSMADRWPLELKDMRMMGDDIRFIYVPGTKGTY